MSTWQRLWDFELKSNNIFRLSYELAIDFWNTYQVLLNYKFFAAVNGVFQNRKNNLASRNEPAYRYKCRPQKESWLVIFLIKLSLGGVFKFVRCLKLNILKVLEQKKEKQTGLKPGRNWKLWIFVHGENRTQTLDICHSILCLSKTAQQKLLHFYLSALTQVNIRCWQFFPTIWDMRRDKTFWVEPGSAYSARGHSNH